MKKITLLLLIAALFYSTYGADTDGQITRSEKINHTRELKVNISFGAGTVIIHRLEDTTLLFKARLSYQKKEPKINFQQNDGIAQLDISTPSFKKEEMENETRLSIGDWGEVRDNVWHLYFTSQIPISFNIVTGAAESEFDFGGMAVKRLDIDCGASDMFIDFSSPTTIPLKRFTIEVGVSKLEIQRLLNANFKQLYFEGGMGEYVFYLNGNLNHTVRLSLSTGIASTTLFIADSIPFKAQIDHSFLSSVHIDDAQQQDDCYRSSDFNNNLPHVRIEAEVGLGSLAIKRED